MCGGAGPPDQLPGFSLYLFACAIQSTPDVLRTFLHGFTRITSCVANFVSCSIRCPVYVPVNVRIRDVPVHIPNSVTGFVRGFIGGVSDAFSHIFRSTAWCVIP